MPCVLAIGGLDPGGGAGVVADLRALASTGASGAFGAAVVAVQTVQSTSGLRSALAVDTRLVIAQATCVLREQRVRAVKLGALGSVENVRAIARLLGKRGGYGAIPVVLDTPMVASRGRGAGRLLAKRAVDALREALLPRATLVTVNAEEASVLVGEPVRTVGEAHDAARWLVKQGGARAALVKGGHLGGGESRAHAIDVLAIGGEVVELRAPRLRGPGRRGTHGTGCTLASLIAGQLARRQDEGAGVTDADVVAAVQWAKGVHHAALAHAVDVGGTQTVLVF